MRKSGSGQTNGQFLAQLKEEKPDLFIEFMAERGQLVKEGARPKEAISMLRPRYAALAGLSPQGNSAPIDPDNPSLSGFISRIGTDYEFLVEKKTSKKNAVQWVAENVANLNVEPQDSPSAEAWNLLQWARLDETTYHEFWRTVWPKTLPPSKAFETADNFVDDGREEMAIADKLLAIKGGAAA